MLKVESRLKGPQHVRYTSIMPEEATIWEFNSILLQTVEEVKSTTPQLFTQPMELQYMVPIHILQM